MLLSDEVDVRWNNSNKKYYISKGYNYTKNGDTFKVKIEDLTKSSKVLLNVKCDGEDCENPYLKPITWDNYKRYVKEDGKYYCNKCALNLYGTNNRTKNKLKNGGKSFEQWCIENNKQYILNRWDYNLNEYLPSEVLYGTHKKYYFKCPENIHKSELKNIKSYINNGYEGSMFCNQCNSLGSIYSESINCWSDKNKKSPFDYPPMSHQYVYFKCLEGIHKDFKKKIYSAVNHNFRCPECSNIIGEKHPMWNGGITQINYHLRQSINQWKLDSMVNCDYKCVITGNAFAVIHHLKGFSSIVAETFEEIDLPIYTTISDYSQDQLINLRNKFIEIHNKYPLGVCLSENIHRLFHSLYGIKNNTPEQFEEFKTRYNNGEFNDLLQQSL